MPITNVKNLNKRSAQEVTLTLESFAGGENTISTDAEAKNNEARVLENWDPISLGGMIRSKGFNEIADGGVTYTDMLDLLIQHEEGSGSELYGVIEGDLVIKSGSDINQEDASGFTSGTLCHGVSAGDKLFITNSTDNLKVKTIGNALAAATDQPTKARDRIYQHKNRLIAEGGDKTIYVSRAGTGNFNAADTWSLANDASNIDLPDDTRGCAPSFPGGNETAVFTRDKAYAIYNFPDIRYRPIPNSHGCGAPYSIAKGNEGVFFVSRYPTLGVYLWDGVNFTNLTQFNDFVNDISFSNRIYGVYRNQKYHLFYNETGSGASYPNRWRIYHTLYGRWMNRPVNADLADNMGYPAVQVFSNNELYVGSSRKDKIYELETTDNSDEGNNTEANYKTKDYTSADFDIPSGGGKFPIDEVRMKLIKMVITYYGTTGNVTVQWTADRGLHSGSQIVTISASGDLINDTFVVNTSNIVTLPPDKTITRTFSNNAIGTRFNFQILNNATGERPKIKKIKIHAIILDEE